MPLLFLLISGLLITSWFRSGLIYGGGDVGLQTYDPQTVVQISRYIWWEATAPGSPTPQGLTALPFNLIFSVFQLIGFTPVALQASFFFLILFFMGWGMYLLIVFLLGESFRKYALLGGLFYLFNPYMMISVWHRFVHSTFFLAAALPFLIIFWLKWIRYGRVTSLLLFLIINLLAVYAFGTIAYILTLWLLLFLITAPEMIFPWVSFNNAKKIMLLFLIGFLFWFLTNFWWLTPIFKIAPGFLSEQHTNEQTLSTLYNLGLQTVLPYSLQMVNPFYLFYQLDFGANYQQNFWRIIPWIFVAIILVGLLRGIFNTRSARWSIIYLVVFVLAKGVASPMGYFYDFGMRYFFPLGVLRNPFEKIGILLPILSSILLVVGLKIIFDFLKTKNNYLAIFSLLVIIIPLFLFSWPMWKGGIFGKIDNPAFVDVPQSYNSANLWIKSEILKKFSSSPGKILHLPLTTGEAVTYNWEHGYSGLDPNVLLFTSAPSLSHGFNIKQVDNAMNALYQGFHKPDLVSQEVILRLLQDFNIRYIVLHKDTKWEGGEFYDPSQTAEVLDSLQFFEKPLKFGELVVYKISDNYFRPKITLSGSFDWISTLKAATFWPWILSDDRTLITDLNKQRKKDLDNLSINTYIFPKASFNSIEASSSATLQLINQLISNPSLDNLWFEPLLKLKEIYRRNNEIQSEETNDKLISASRKILKMLRQFKSTDLKEYAKEMRAVFSSPTLALNLYAKEKITSDIFQTHLYVLRKLKATEEADELKNNLIKNNFISSYYSENSVSPLPEKQVLKFEISQVANYELLLVPAEGENQDKQTVLIDGRLEKLNTKIDGNIISLGEIFLTAGLHEIGLPFSTNKEVILRRLNPDQKNNVFSIVSFEQKSPVLYIGNFHLDESTLLTFAESYHPNWKLILTKEGREVTAPSHLLANLYANAWLINDAGNYQFKLEFEPQRMVNFGFGLAIIAYGSLIFFSLLTQFKKQ